jgi:hypothetical protein
VRAIEPQMHHPHNLLQCRAQQGEAAAGAGGGGREVLGRPGRVKMDTGDDRAFYGMCMYPYMEPPRFDVVT